MAQRLLKGYFEREALRARGQFWTPDWIAEAMIAYVLGAGSDIVFDPAVGAGAFLHAAKKVAGEIGRRVALTGIEIDPLALRQAQNEGLTPSDLSGVWIGDFVQDPPEKNFKAIVANPPYIRHHRLSVQTKTYLRWLGKQITGSTLDGRAGLHIYFLLQALQLLDKRGRLAFIMPADSVEGVFAPQLWSWIGSHYRLDAVVTFSPEASPFPNVDTNPIIFMIENDAPQKYLIWSRCNRSETNQLKQWVLSKFKSSGESLTVQRRRLDEALATGLSRPANRQCNTELTLGDFASVIRGIATGANEFFYLTRKKAQEIDIPPEFLVPAIGRTRDVKGHEVTLEDLKESDAVGRPTLLFSPDDRPMRLFPLQVQVYLKHGEDIGIAARKLITTRHPWYKMERRKAPPILFAYLGRRNVRFVRNRAGVVPLTGFLCVYPYDNSPEAVEKLWRILQHPETVANLAYVGKSYGGGAIKVEPRALEMLPLPDAALSAENLKRPARPRQFPLY